MRVTRDEVIQHLTPPEGIVMAPYKAGWDRIYRWCLVSIAIGAGFNGIASLAGIASGWAHAIDGWYAIANLSASLTFLVWLKSWRYLVRSLGVVGLILWPLWELGSLAATLLVSSIMASKETHCFHFPAGRIIPWWSLALGIAILLALPMMVLGIGWIILAILWGWLALERHQLPVFDILPGHSET